VASLLTLEEAQERVLERARLLSPELVPIAEAGGRVIAEEVRARVDLPPFASSAMDGFAVRAADLPGELRLIGESAAGRPFGGRLEPGSAVAVSTGAVVPEGADAVAPVWRSRSRLGPARTSVLGAATLPRARSWSRRA
jgi:molybdopterin molybdotransferase